LGTEKEETMKRGDLIGLIVVVFFIGGLAVMYLASGPPDGTQRRVECICRQTQVGTATITFASESGGLMPGYRAAPPSGWTNQQDISWVTQLLPHLGRGDVFDACGQMPAGSQPSAQLDTLICPSNPNVYSGGSQDLICYITNTGQPDVDLGGQHPPDWAENGVFTDRSRAAIDEFGERLPAVSLGDIARGDGMSSTLLLSENTVPYDWYDTTESKLGMVWFPTKKDGKPSPCGQLAKINNDLDAEHDGYYYSRPSSFHRGGFVATFCDGHTRFLSEDIDYVVYCLLLSPNGRDTKIAGSDEPVPDIYRYRLISEADIK
jgi:hypothetical protein